MFRAVFGAKKLKRVQGDKDKKYANTIDEIADVKIMIRQAERIFDSELINQRVDFKMNRLKERIKSKTNESNF
jgi:hypothetical protein